MNAGTVHEALQRAGRVDAEELEVAADVAEAAIGRRLAARVERAHDHRVADANPSTPLADLGNGARHLVPDHLRRSTRASIAPWAMWRSVPQTPQ